jgi:tRNA pseudouridine55 synthase
MEKVLKLYKKEGETPLECMNRFRAMNPEYKNVPMTYAGRLDPLACGELLVLAAEKVHEKETYCSCDKEYRVEALLGYGTDTYDILGIPRECKTPTAVSKPSQKRHDFLEGEVHEILTSFLGKKTQPYPPYSSRTVDGKPLWLWAREGKLDAIEIPTHPIEIYRIEDIQVRKITQEDILERVGAITDLVQGDFRQDEIKKKWDEIMRSRVEPGKTSSLVSFRVKCSSGTYIRSLVHELGKNIGSEACIFRLERTQIFTK